VVETSAWDRYPDDGPRSLSERDRDERDRAESEAARTGAEPAPPDAPCSPVVAAAALNLAMRVGDCLLSAGMSANDVVVVLLRITAAYRMSRVHIDVTYTSLSASYYPGPEAAPITCIRVVRPDVVDYSRVRELDKLSDDIQGGLPIEGAIAKFDRIIAAPHPYPQWLSTAGNAGVGAGVSLLFTTSWKIVLITFLTGCVVDRLLALLQRVRVPPFFQQAAAAGLITMIAAGITAGARHGVRFFDGLDPTLVVVGGIVLLVSGMTVVGAVQDAIDQFYVTASARMFEVAMLTAGIVVGIVLALKIAPHLGAPVYISPDPIGLGPLWAQFVGAALTSGLFALWAYADPLTMALSAATGALGWAGYTAMIRSGAAEVPANAVGALAAALVATLIVRRTNIPGFALISAALLPLVPGLSLYNGLLELVGTSSAPANTSTGSSTLALAVSVALGIAAGASLGTYLGRPLADQMRRIRSHARRRRSLTDA
jgi:uncharacterized membrane protein YjjP (DUF1212 family)